MFCNRNAEFFKSDDFTTNSLGYFAQYYWYCTFKKADKKSFNTTKLWFNVKKLQNFSESLLYDRKGFINLKSDDFAQLVIFSNKKWRYCEIHILQQKNPLILVFTFFLH